MSHPASLADWKGLVDGLSIRTQAFVGGEYVDAASGETFECVNPADNSVITRVAATDSEDVDRAVAAARRAFEKGSWSRMAPAARKDVLFRFADLIRTHQDELAALETIDMGKPIADSTTIDIPGAARCIAWYAEAIDKVYDEVAPTSHDSIGLITREPVGVVACVVPWNFPLLMAAWKIAPALATGNSVILKPSEKSPLTAIRVAELAAEAGIPEGVFNVVPGFGQTAGKALALHDDVDCIAFTGSTAVWSAAARAPILSSRTAPIWTRRPRLPASASSSTRARCVRQRHDCWSRTVSVTNSWRNSSPSPPPCSRGTPSIRTRAWGPSSTTFSSIR
jgi:acyl-CoA reductase-like NAD-dependent aldehyde dehydrogenase